MIPEERLRIAAQETYALYADWILSTIDCETSHTFSPEFEEKIEKIKRNIGKKFCRPVLQKVASFILAVLLCTSVWLSVDAQARSKVFGWMREVCGDWFVFHYEGGSESADSADVKEYCITWIPEGYKPFYEDLTGEIKYIVYTNEIGELLKFEYAQRLENSVWAINYADTVQKTTKVNGVSAEMFISTTQEHSNTIMWEIDDGTKFYISGFVTEKTLVKIAKNIEILEK